MKKILALAMVLSVLGSVVGCGSSETAPADAAATPAAGTTPAPAADKAAE